MEADKNNLNHTPNHISPVERILSVAFTLGLIIYGTIGFIIDDIYVPGKRSSGLRFHGVPCWIMYGAFLFAASSLLSVVIDHYDKRNNETNYKRFSKLTRRIAVGFFISAFIIDLLIYHQSTKGY